MDFMHQITLFDILRDEYRHCNIVALHFKVWHKHQTEYMGGTKGSHLVLDHPELLEAIKGREFFFENE